MYSHLSFEKGVGKGLQNVSLSIKGFILVSIAYKQIYSKLRLGTNKPLTKMTQTYYELRNVEDIVIIDSIYICSNLNIPKLVKLMKSV